MEITTVASNYHIEVNPSDVGIYDYVVVQEIIKEIAQYKQLDALYTKVKQTQYDKVATQGAFNRYVDDTIGVMSQYVTSPEFQLSRNYKQN